MDNSCGIDNSDNKKIIKPDIVLDMFKDVHNEYLNYFEGFQKRIQTIMDEDLTPVDIDNIVEWGIEYNNSVSYLKTILGDFEEQIKLKKYDINDEMVKNNEIFDKVKNVVLPMAIVCWLAFSIDIDNLE